MSERKVLNKYYPPDFDPSKIPRMKLPKNRQYTVRLMAPFNMRCKTCGEYIYKGKKFNARKEDVENEDYFGIRIYRFYIKCTRCLQEISFKTDPKNTDYEIEAGATRNFMALKLAEEQALREEEEAREEEQSNPMKLLENRTKQSKNEIEVLESLEELKDLKRRQETINYDGMLLQFDTRLSQQEREEKLRQLDEEYIKSIKFHSSQKRKIVVEEEVEIIDDDQPNEKMIKAELADNSKETDLQSTHRNETISIWNNLKPSTSCSSANQSSSSSSSTKKLFAGLVKIKRNNNSDNSQRNSENTIINSSSVKDSDSLGTVNVASKTSESSATENNERKPVNSLSLLAGYTDSEDSEND